MTPSSILQECQRPVPYILFLACDRLHYNFWVDKTSRADDLLDDVNYWLACPRDFSFSYGPGVADV
jgi:hypothetical protein